jgi:iron complex outermembrane recepter protein
MSLLSQRLGRLALCAALALPFAATLPTAHLYAQSTASLSGSVFDPRGVLLPGAQVTLKDQATGLSHKMKSDATGKYLFSGLAAGKYTLIVDASGFNTSLKQDVIVADGQSVEVDDTLELGNVSEEITVEASEANSVAAAMAPMDALLNETSARTEITQAFISNYTSPVADYGETIQMAPSTFTLNGNGVGLGQSKTYFRGFPDGDYDIDFDGIPFYDTNSPSHHSWAFFPSQFLGGVDFDRSPGTASTIGPTPFGGSIHLLSKDMSPVPNLRATFSGGSFNTYLYDAAYDSGAFGHGHKFATSIDIHHLQSHGYQSLNNQEQNAGDLKLVYRLSDKTTLTGYSAVIWLDANTPNFSATRCQMYGQPAVPTAANNCFLSGSVVTGGALYPFTGAGINFLLTNNQYDPMLYLNDEYNNYHVPTDFEYVGIHKEMAKGVTIDVKPYTYDYDNSEKYSNVVPITDDPALAGKTYAPLAAKIVDCNTPVTSKGITAIPCGVDKYNSYRKYGETGNVSQVSRFGILSTGLWYEWANTNRHQYPSDPVNHWADQALPNFAETFVTNSYQPYVQYELHVIPKLNIIPGVKWAYYTIGTKQFADDGKTIGGLGTNNPASFVANQGSYFATLPSLELNYRIRSNWSVFAQGAQGSIVPPSSVFDFQQGTAGTTVVAITLPKQQKNTTYEFGTVFKLKNVTFDADYYHIHFDNSYSCVLNTTSGDDNICSPQPASITQGLEGEANVYLGHGLSTYLNASYDHGVYTGTLSVPCNTGATCTSTTPSLVETTPHGLNIASTPSDVETEGFSYTHSGWDAGFFNKRVGTFYLDSGVYHNQFTITPFATANAFLNYTLHTGGRFDQTKVRLSFNNVFNRSSVTGVSLAGKATGQTISANGTTYADMFNTVLPQVAPNGQDNVSVLPGRSIMLSITMGWSTKR